MTILDKSEEISEDLSTLNIAGKTFNKHVHTGTFTCYTMTCQIESDEKQKGNNLNNTYWHSNELTYANSSPTTAEKVEAKAMSDSLTTDSSVEDITLAWKFWNDLQGYIENPIPDVITPVE